MCSTHWLRVRRVGMLPGATAGELFGGSVLAEQVFAYPGLGRMTVEAGLSGDIPLLLGITLAITALISVGNMIADLAYLIIDPRMRSGFVEREGWQ
jgi:peptide/nickel transport system permease protein